MNRKRRQRTMPLGKYEEENTERDFQWECYARWWIDPLKDIDGQYLLPVLADVRIRTKGMQADFLRDLSAISPILTFWGKRELRKAFISKAFRSFSMVEMTGFDFPRGPLAVPEVCFLATARQTSTAAPTPARCIRHRRRSQALPFVPHFVRVSRP